MEKMESSSPIKGSLNHFPDLPIRLGVSYGKRGKFRGLISELKIYLNALSDEEIADLYMDDLKKYKE